MQPFDARCIVCGRALPPAGDPLVCDTCPRPASAAPTLPPAPALVPPGWGTAEPGMQPGRIPGLLDSPLPPTPVRHLPLWEALGLGLAVSFACGALLYASAVATDASWDVLTLPVGIAIGAALRLDPPPRWRWLTIAAGPVLALATFVISTYFVQRWAAVRDLRNEAGFDPEVPLVLPLGDAAELVGDTVGAHPIVLLWWALGAALATGLRRAVTR